MRSIFAAFILFSVLGISQNVLRISPSEIPAESATSASASGAIAVTNGSQGLLGDEAPTSMALLFAGLVGLTVAGNRREESLPLEELVADA